MTKQELFNKLAEYNIINALPIKAVKHSSLTEDKLMKMCIDYIEVAYPHLRNIVFHVNNEGKKHKLQAYRDKAMKRVKKGVVDIIIARSPIIVIELKKPSRPYGFPDEQLIFMRDVVANGGISIACADFDMFKKTVDSIL